MESYTINFPYKIKDLHLDKKIICLKREDVESSMLIKEAKSIAVALLVYGNPLAATTHMSLILDAEKSGIKCKVIHSASIFDGIAETGLQIYKFGKTASMPSWKKNYQPDSFMDIVRENQKIKAHSLILIDIDLSFKKAIKQLEQSSRSKKIKIQEIVVCSKIGAAESKIKYGSLEKMKKENFPLPICFIVPSELHFLEKESLKRFEQK